MRIAPAIALSPEQRAALEQRARSRSLAARVVDRARSFCWPPRADGIKRLQ
jgi:hypothetical protein